MNKNLINKLIVILILALAFVGILSLKDITLARGLEGNNELHSVGKEKLNDIGFGKDEKVSFYTSALTGESSSDETVSSSEYVYCIQAGQAFTTDHAEYTLDKIVTVYSTKIEIQTSQTDIITKDSSTQEWKYAQGLAYLLNLESNSYPSDAQIAIWAYIKYMGVYAEDIGLYDLTQSVDVIDSSKIKYTLSTTGTTGESENAYAYYDAAVNIATNGPSTEVYEAKYYIFFNESINKLQPLLVLHSSKSEEIPSNLSLDLTKTSSIGKSTDGTEFKVGLTNIKEIKVQGKYISSLLPKNTIFTITEKAGSWYIVSANTSFKIEDLYLMVADGRIKVEEIKIADITQNVNITLTETETVNGHKIIEDSIKMSVKCSTTKASLESHTPYSEEIKNIKIATDDKFKVEVELENFVVIDVKGKVWLDGQTGIKPSATTDGKIDNGEQGIENIKVCLCDKNGNIKYSTTTDETEDHKGEYKFEQVSVEEGDYVSFEYDGINYIETKATGSPKVDSEKGSHADENTDERKNFNNKFTTIDSTNKCGSIDLEYDDTTSDTKSTLKTTNEDGTVKTNFKMTAKADIKVEKAEDGKVELNCGLVKREFDLDLTTNLEYVESKINGQTTYYQYSIDENGNAIVYLRDAEDNKILPKYQEVDENGNIVLTNAKETNNERINYNQHLYESDYNFNIDNYISHGDSLDDSQGIKDNKYDNNLDGIPTTSDGGEAVLKKEDELSVEVTYKIVLNNQTNKKAYVYKIKDYYSEEFEFVNVVALDTEKTQVVLSVGNETNSGEYKTKEITLDYQNEKDLENTLEMYITFKVPKYKKDEDGNYIIGENGEYILTDAWKNINDIDKDERLTVGNIAEITSYGSAEGYIDMDSAPGNANIGTANERYEDDTDKAGGLKISVTNDEKRTLSGVVWDDSSSTEETKKENGEYDEGEPLINDVTVQLIELKDIVIAGKTYQLEYIWQETKTGSNKVYQISETGEKIKELTNSIVTNTDIGKYEFVDYIPGKYIVRYKYGLDGGKYNGNDYKSTYNKTEQNRYKYNSDEFEFTNYLYEDTQYSDAYDNEARRLKEMSLFAGTDISKDSITVDKLKEHWMCADTNKFDVAIASNDKQIEYNTNSKTQIAKGVDSTQSNDNSEYNLPNIDFGLMERPATKIELEKHITGLTINVAGEGNIVDAKFDIANKHDEGDWTKVLEGVTNNLSTTKSTRDNKGFWKLETDVNDLMNGAELTVEYTYVISNNSTEDYLSEQLVKAYEKLTSNFTCQFKYEGETAKVTLLPGEGDGTYTYSKLLEELEGKVKLDIRQDKHTNGYYLGTFYYTGVTDDVDGLPKIAKTTVQVSKIEELLNNEFNFDDKINYSSYGGTNDYFAQYEDVAAELAAGIPTIKYAHATIGTDGKTSNSLYKFYDTEGNSHDFVGDDDTNASTGNKKLSDYTIVQSIPGKNFLATGDIDTGKKIVLTKTLNTSNINNMSYDSYIAEILSYSVASGRRDVNSTPGNLTYSHSDDEKITLSAINSENKEYNENDEFWGETIIITSSTGEDKISTTWWIIIGTISAGIIVVGIFGIKIFVLAKH